MKPVLGILVALAVATAQAESPKAQPQRPQPLFNGKNLDGWKPAVENAYLNPGKAAVRDGVIQMPQGAIATGVVYAKEFPKRDYEVTLEARRTEGSDFFCGMTFPVSDQHCTLILGGWGGGTTGLSNVDGFSADENETTDFIEFENGRWYAVRLRVADGKIQAWVDKQQIVDLKTEDRKFNIWWEQEPLRPFGVGNWRCSSELRKITLTRLNARP
ncbi:MAG: DUF1080 domain-containing protein [Planctomycetales bacterium]|nr:DUF1080 domain-containing protein [Planctomycetales bacterium]